MAPSPNIGETRELFSVPSRAWEDQHVFSNPINVLLLDTSFSTVFETRDPRVDMILVAIHVHQPHLRWLPG